MSDSVCFASSVLKVTALADTLIRLSGMPSSLGDKFGGTCNCKLESCTREKEQVDIK